MNTINWLEQVRLGTVISDIGQIDKQQRRELDNAAKRGEIVKFRGYWYPHEFSVMGLGPLKTCFALPEMFDAYANEYQRKLHTKAL